MTRSTILAPTLIDREAKQDLPIDRSDLSADRSDVSADRSDVSADRSDLSDEALNPFADRHYLANPTRQKDLSSRMFLRGASPRRPS